MTEDKLYVLVKTTAQPGSIKYHSGINPQVSALMQISSAQLEFDMYLTPFFILG